jgi:hypothetical protein
MTRLSERKTRLTFETAATARYRGKERAIVVEPDLEGQLVALRLKGTRVRYELSWQAIYNRAAMVHADRARAERKGGAR